MRGRASSWAVSLFAHGGVAAALIVGVPWPDPPGAVDQGLQGIEVSLSAGGMPGAKAPEPPPPPPEPEKIVEKPVEPPPAPPPEPVKTPEVVESQATQPDIEEAPKPKPKPVAEVPRRPPPPKPPKEIAKAPPEPTPQPPQPQQQQVAVAPSPVPASPGQSGQRPAPNSGNGAATTSGGNPGAEADYFATLLAWLERHKEYPRRAQMRRIEGVTHLRFTIDGQGHVLRYRIERSSGYETLDDAVERMIKKAEPLPAIPAEVGKDRLELVVPVQFLLK